MIIGFNFDKISVEKKTLSKEGKLEIKNNLKLEDVSESKITLGENEKPLKFDFTFTVSYEPKVGEILLKGHVLYLVKEAKQREEITKAWKKDNKLPGNMATDVMNVILSKCNIKSLQLSQEVNLPPSIQLPRIQPKSKEKQYIG